jgi:hypothetical protein
VNSQSGWLIYDQKVIILIRDIQRNSLRQGSAGRGGRDTNIYPVASIKFKACLSRTAINHDTAISNKPLRVGAGEFQALLTNILIQPSPSFINHKTIYLVIV